MRITNDDSNIYIKKELGKRIKKIRVLKKMTQFELAEKTGISPRAITRIENGNINASFDSILNILRFFNLLENLELLIPNQDNNSLNNKIRYRKSSKDSSNDWKWGDER